MISEAGAPNSGSNMGADVIAHLLARPLGAEADRESVVGRIAREVAQDIIEGRIPPGAEVTSLELSKRFGSSRTPPREALLMLEREGLIELRPRRRPRAVFLPRENVREIYELRALLYGVVARGIVAHAKDDELSALQDVLDQMVAAAESDDTDRYFWNNVLFHEITSDLCGNGTLKQTIDGLGLRVLQLRHFGMTRSGRLSRSAADHARLLLALRERDADLAAALNQSIVLNALPGLLSVYDDIERLAAKQKTVD